jgi:hypothetical protein
MCQRFPLLCGTPWPPPGPVPEPPFQSFLLGRTQTAFRISGTPVVLPFALEARQLRDLRTVMLAPDAALAIELELDVVDPAPGEIIRVEMQRISGDARPSATWLGVGQAAFFVPANHKGVETKSVVVTLPLREVLDQTVRGDERVLWRLRRVSGRETRFGIEVPPSRGVASIREVRLLMKPTPARPETKPQ